MTDKVMEFLVASGGGSLDELIVRVPNDPKEIAESLTQLADKHYIKAAGQRVSVIFTPWWPKSPKIMVTKMTT